MIRVRRSDERGHFDHGWLDTFHTFSFADYQDPAHMGFRKLRVINEDRVAPAEGFGTHGHRDMEIVTIVLEGALEHKDSMGNGSVIRPGDVQRMTAGTGVTHSEFNASRKDPVHLLQIWILPERAGLKPGYEQTTFPEEDRADRLCLVASGSPKGAAVKIHQDAELFVASLGPGKEVRHALASERHAWVQVARGAVKVNGTALSAGDGAAVGGEKELRIAASAPSEILLFDLA
ncbi:MAG TPA: pirin family protein [Candidatus Eisenbacteria bacterium]|nr:pirin family protein [Candidatus Eisenbacteria bacterium]